MVRRALRGRLPWLLLLAVGLVIAALAFMYVAPPPSRPATIPAVAVTQEPDRGTVISTAGPTDGVTARQPPMVPSDAVLAEQLSLNGYAVKVWDMSATDLWECGRAMVEVIEPDGAVSTIDWVSRLNPVSGQDITGDGNPDVVIERYSGGASCCLSYVVLSLGEELASISLPLNSPAGASFGDLDLDGVLEVIGTDDSFRCVLCCCANSPEPVVVLKYSRGRGYVPASPEFPEVYDPLIPEYRARAESRLTGPFEEQDPTGRCYVLPLVLAYLYSGRADAAWEALAQYIPSAADATALRREIERIVSGSRLFVAPESWSDLLTSREKTFSVQVDLNGDGADETVIGVEAATAEGLPEYASPGDVYVFTGAPQGTGTSRAFPPLFACRSSLPSALLPYFFQAALAGTGDLDGDGLGDVALVWLGQQWWPSAYRPLAVLQFDPETRSYRMLIDIHRSVCEIGDYATADVDDDGRPEILEIDPIYGTVIDPSYGSEVYECHFCPHRYEVRVLEFVGDAFVADSCVNSGEPFVTSQKYEPYVEDTPVGSFLPELVALARSLVQSPSATVSGLPDR